MFGFHGVRLDGFDCHVGYRSGGCYRAEVEAEIAGVWRERLLYVLQLVSTMM